MRLKLDIDEYKTEDVQAVVNYVNGMLDKMGEKVGELADCIDNCYEERIKEIDDELEKVFEEFADGMSEMNGGLERGFELEKMAEIRGMKVSMGGGGV